MLSSRWYKVLNDLWDDKTRTVLIVLSIAVGLFAVGTIISSRSILSSDMAKSFAAIRPSTGTVRTIEEFDESFVRSVRRMPEVADADARRILQVRVQVNDDDWKNLIVFAVEDYEDMRVNIITPDRGRWPPPDKGILIERAALPLLDAEIGDRLRLKLPNDNQRILPIAGTAHDLAQLPAQFDGTPYGYVSFETLEWFGEPYGFNELHIIANNKENKEYAQYVLNQVKDRAERVGLTIPLSMTAEPGMLPLDDILQAVLLLMGTLGALSLGLSAFLIVNTVTALLTQQRRQIGVMKAIGARTDQLMGMYLAMVMLYGTLALLIAVPLSLTGSRQLSRFMAAMFNFDLIDVQTPLFAVLLQIAIALVIPILASLYPFVATLRISAAAAMRAGDIGKGRFGAGWFDQLLSGSNLWFARNILRRPILLSIRNIFRNKGRLVLTLLTLTLGGAIFIGVFSVNASLGTTVDDLLKLYNFDSMVIFERPYRVDKIIYETESIPGVIETDIWIQVPARRVRPDGSEGGQIYLFAPRAGSQLVPGPKIVQGRWLMPEDENAIVIDAILLKDEPDLRLGDQVVMKIGGHEHTFCIVGISLGIMAPMTYAHYPYIAEVTGRVGEADVALVATDVHDEASVLEVMRHLESHLERNGLHVSLIGTIATERAEANAFFGIITNLLMVMAILLAIVGGLGLMGTMSINVLERTREIGVLRAIGAPNRGVSQVFIREGIAIGVLSWLLGALLAIPLGRLLSDAVGIPVMGTPLQFTYSITGVWVWLLIVVVLSALASFLPARRASRLTVREVLAYE